MTFVSNNEDDVLNVVSQNTVQSYLIVNEFQKWTCLCNSQCMRLKTFLEKDF